MRSNDIGHPTSAVLSMNHRSMIEYIPVVCVFTNQNNNITNINKAKMNYSLKYKKKCSPKLDVKREFLKEYLDTYF